jgi:hypothetical protein
VGASGDNHEYPDPTDQYVSSAPTRSPTSMPTGAPTPATPAPTPTSSVLPYPCTRTSPPLQIIENEDANGDLTWDVKRLEIADGAYTLEYAIVNQDIGGLNAAGINPIDSKVLPVYAAPWVL